MCVNVRSQTVILSKQGLPQHQVKAEQMVSLGSVHVTLNCFEETGLVVSKA